MLIICYPLILSLIVFPYFQFQDSSFQNYMEFVLTALLLGLAGSNFGFMWGTIFTNEADATISSIVYLLVGSLGAG
jgi:hypothetical protein